MITQYDLIIFDWDGTLVDSIDWIVECIQIIAKHQGIDQPSQQACKDIIGLSLSEAMVTLFPELSDDEKIAMVAAYREVYLAKKISTKDLFVDTLPTLEKLKQMGKTLAVATGKGQSGLDRSLDGTGDRKSTRLNSSHDQISYAVFCLKKKNKVTHNLDWGSDFK